ncbi:MAG: CdaR family protein [Candidatus Marinimicrobia bacterium]|nr:CdaR family protein [Candidatus Neomarinimicrobiota bacterium]
MKNILPKIVVILSAVILWLLIVSGQTYIGVIDLPLSIYEPREEMTLGQELPKTVKVRVEGPGRSLYFHRWSKKSSLILDVGTITDSQKISLKDYFEERPNQVRLQLEMEFLEVVYPDSIDVMIDNKIEKTVQVQIISDISVRSGFIQVNDPEMKEVVLTGPENYLKNIETVQSGMLVKENIDMSFQSEVQVLNPNSELVTLSPEQINVAINVEMIGERTISNIPIQIKNQPNDLNIQFIPNTISLRVTGGNNQIQNLTRQDFYVYFDYLSQWFPNKNFYPVKMTSPDEVLDVIRIIPEQIEVVVIRKNKEE